MPRRLQSRSRSAHDSLDSRNPSASAISSLRPSARTPIITSRHTLSVNPGNTLEAVQVLNSLVRSVTVCLAPQRMQALGTAAASTEGSTRDRALILVGIVAALRRSEIVGLDVTDLTEHPNGMVIELARSKTNQRDR